jgi:tRNA (guanine37-N1)-methyltransferase
VLLSGDHAAIRQWRRKQSVGRTWQRRPDLFARRAPSTEEQALLSQYQAEQSSSING